MKPVRLIAIALASLVVVGCAKDPVGPPSRITALPRALTAAEQQLVQANNRFAIKLLQQATADTRDTLPNLFISPLLGLTSVGPGPIVIDRPFLFALRENLSGTILFVGVIRHPPTN